MTPIRSAISPLPLDQHLPRVLALMLLLVTLAACSGAQADEEPTILNIRQPHATFTPTPFTPASAPAAQAGAAQTGSGQDANVATTGQSPDGSVANGAPGTAADDAPKAIVNASLVNIRTGPDTNYAIVAEVERGAEFTIVGKDEVASWWQVCCYNDQEVWIIDTLVDTIGAVDTVQTVANIPPPSQQANVAPVAAAPVVAATAPTPVPPPTEPPPPTVAPPPAAPEFAFALEGEKGEQFPETNVTRIFLFVHDGQDGLPGYSLRVSKNGAELPVTETSFGPQPGFTWPIADGRQRFQNMKVEFPGQTPGGTWEVQLVDSSRTPVGPSVTFDLAANEPNQELYVRYLKR